MVLEEGVRFRDFGGVVTGLLVLAFLKSDETEMQAIGMA